MSEPDYAAILAPLREVIDRLHDRAKAAEAKLAAVEALHRPWQANQATICQACGDDWPCPTIEAIRCEP